MATEESFKTSFWGGWIISSHGYSLRLAGRTGIEWRDAVGELRIDSERMSKPSNMSVVYTRSIPDSPDRPRSEVLERLARAFEYAGWILKLEGPEID